MKPPDDLIEKLKHISAPASIASDVERSVMSRILKKHPFRLFYLRRSLAYAAGIVIVCIIAVSSLYRDGFRRIPKDKPPQFVESRIILDNHVCIWLEPIENSNDTRLPK